MHLAPPPLAAVAFVCIPAGMCDSCTVNYRSDLIIFGLGLLMLNKQKLRAGVGVHCGPESSITCIWRRRLAAWHLKQERLRVWTKQAEAGQGKVWIYGMNKMLISLILSVHLPTSNLVKHETRRELTPNEHWIQNFSEFILSPREIRIYWYFNPSDKIINMTRYFPGWLRISCWDVVGIEISSPRRLSRNDFKMIKSFYLHFK